jgi:hypothetical protein
MENPWKNISEETSKYIADCDKVVIKKLDLESKFDFSILPHPYMGDPVNAEIFLLNGNPNIGAPNKGIDHKIFTKEHKDIVLNNLEHKIVDYPLYGINGAFKNYFVFKWWFKHLEPIIKKIKNPQKVSKKIFEAEYVPYFSDKFIPVTVPSQKYTFDIIERAIDNNKVIIIMRGKNEWENAIQNLNNFCNKFVLHSAQNVIISSGNLDDGKFEEIIKRIK